MVRVNGSGELWLAGVPPDLARAHGEGFWGRWRGHRELPHRLGLVGGRREASGQGKGDGRGGRRVGTRRRRQRLWGRAGKGGNGARSSPKGDDAVEGAEESLTA